MHASRLASHPSVRARGAFALALALAATLASTAVGHAQTASRTVLLEGIGDAENATFSDDGRLFVTGGSNVYELEQERGAWKAVPLFEGSCNFTGVVTRDGYLYASCLAGTTLTDLQPQLVAGALTKPVSLRVIDRYTRDKLPNGMAFDGTGRLLVTDFSPLGGQIVALTLDGPLSVAREEVWRKGGTLVNGLKVFDGSAYVTDAGDVLRIPIQADGSAGRARTLASRLTLLDDLMVDAEGIVATNHLGNKLFFFSHEGTLRRETSAVFSAPSSVTRTRGPLLDEGALLITEKGALNELTSRDGNRVTLYVP